MSNQVDKEMSISEKSGLPTNDKPQAPAAKPPAPLAEPQLIVSSSPHFHASSTVDSIMRWVLVALAPACLAGIYFFGLDALRVLLIFPLSAWAGA